MKQIPLQDRVLWIHAASMGEFEQAKPIIEYIREIEKEQISIVVTFFSPSGYEHQKNYQYADYITYLPIDTYRTMNQFVTSIHPTVVVFIRYEIWPNLLQILGQKAIPYFFVNATYPQSWFWESIGRSFLRQLLSNSNGIYTVNEQNYLKFKRLVTADIVHRSADTRIDRIVETVRTYHSEDWYPIPSKPVIVLGSSWEEEEHLFLSVSPHIREQFHCIIVPHKPEKTTIQRLKTMFDTVFVLSELSMESKLENEIVVVDSVGKLLSLYSKASVAFVGGGFGRCVHSTAEAIAYGIPVFCGPNITGSPDATAFEREGILTIVRTKSDIEKLLELVLSDKEWLNALRQKTEKILQPSLGESMRIGEILRTFLH